MKKELLLSSLMFFGASSLWAFDAPKMVDNGAFGAIAPDGSFVAGQCYGYVNIVDLRNDKLYEYYPDEDNGLSYSLGLGNCISNDGVVLLSTNNNNAAYWKDGEFYFLKVENQELTSLSNGITPDGSRICGSMGVAPTSLDEDNTMNNPVYWDRNADGTYGDPQPLPFPDKDFTGYAPQSVTANSISADGKTIAGQVVDRRGMMHFPIIYTQDDSGEWSYTLLAYNEIVPEGSVIPVYPGDSPARPEQTAYMTEENKAAYEAAYEAYISGGYDPALFPDPNDYMSDEQKAAYEEALAAYQVEYDEWDAAFTQYDEDYNTIVENGLSFTFNDVKLTPDGKKYVTTVVSYVEDPSSWWPVEVSSPYILDTAGGESTKLELEGSRMVAGVAGNDVILVCNGISSYSMMTGGIDPMTGWLVKDGECTDLFDYLSNLSPEHKTWMDENLVKEIETYDYETEETVSAEYRFSGVAYASDDLSVIAFWNDCPWDESLVAQGYIFKLGQLGGVKSIVVGDNAPVVRFDAAGNLAVAGNVTAVSVYDLSGRCVLTDAAAAASLPQGVYIVRAQTADGESIAAKIAK